MSSPETNMEIKRLEVFRWWMNNLALQYGPHVYSYEALLYVVFTMELQESVQSSDDSNMPESRG